MSYQTSYRVSDYNRDRDTELQRLQIQLDLTWNKEVRNLQWFGLQDGMSILELGCGPGYATKRLLELFPKSVVTAVEIDPDMVSYSQNYLSSYDRVTIFEAPGNETGLKANTFDFAIARLVFQHVPNPMEITQELFRVLKPGGRLVITDVDEDLFWIFDPPIPESSIASQRFSQAQSAQGGNRKISRQMGRILKQSGFQNIQTEAIATDSDEQGLEPFLIQLDPDLLMMLVKSGFLSQQELEAIKFSWESFISSTDPYVLLLWLMICGVKPMDA